MDRQPAISVIIPVYNVADYIDICMESVVSQSFADFEVLLINDGSTDASGEKCRLWKARDARIRLIEKENEGVAASRNLGVREARGEYLAFVDPDDWLDLRYLEKLYRAVRESGGDFAECDLWRCDNRSGKKIYRSCGARMGLEYTLEEHMKYGPTATYKSLSRRSLWIRHGIRMPDCAFESPAIYALVLALSGSAARVPEALYYYRRFRENSLIETGYAHRDGSPNNTLGIEAMDFLLSEFRRCGLYEQYRAILPGVVCYRLSDILAMQFHRKRAEDYREVVENYRRFLRRAFPDGKHERYVTWGGYNLNRILVHMDRLHDPACRFNFSSLISLAGEKPDAAPFRHKNRYRALMLEREREQTLWELLERQRPALFFLDLIEERFDLVRAGEGWLTRSDAYDGRLEGGSGGEVLSRYSEECTALFAESAARFLRRLRQTLPEIRLVLVENLLSEKVGDLDGCAPFPELSEIRRMNTLLKSYYRILEALWPDAVVIRPDDEELYFTDRKYEYGAVPSHLNELVNQRIAERIEAALAQ